MKKILQILNFGLIIITLTLFFLIISSSNIEINYITILVIFILLALLTFVCGMKINERKTYERNINIYILLYFVFLFTLTMFVKRFNFGLINKENLKYYVKFINIIPFKTIIEFLISKKSISIIISNIFGNFVALMPLSLLLILKNEKNKKISNQFLKISFTVLIIEILQLVFSCGVFDIDDFILNVSGALIFSCFLLKINVVSKITKVFTTDLNIKNTLKNIILIIVVFIIIIVNILLINELINSKNIFPENTEAFMTIDKDTCTDFEVYKNDKYNLHFKCVDIIYEKGNFQYGLSEIIDKNILSEENIERLLNEKTILENGVATLYKSKENNITIILCNTNEKNKDIYIGDYLMQYEQTYCKN